MIRPSRQLFYWRLLRLAGDLAIGLVAMRLSFLIRIYFEIPWTLSRLPADRIRYLFVALLLVLLSQNLMLYFFGFYEPPRPRARLETLRPLLAATTVHGLLLMGYFFLSDQTFPRSIVVLFMVLNCGGLFVWRLLIPRLLRARLRRVAIVGSSDSAREVARNINREHWLGLQVIGYVPTPSEVSQREGPELCDLGPQLGCISHLPRLLEDRVIDDIILAGDARSWQIELVDDLARVGGRRGSVLVLPNPYESLIGRMRYRSIHDTPLIELVRESEWRIDRPFKRLFDVVVAGLLLALALPVIGICAVAIRLSSPGRIFYRQIRIGHDRVPFTLWKLRTMRPDAEEGVGEVLAEIADPRLIRIGGVLRRLRLDELPQLLNVLNGTMSLVGPRPERPGFVKRYLDQIPGYAERFSIRPGLTGLAQIHGHYHSSPQTKLRYDLAYLANWSMWLDLSILVRTVRIVLTSRGT